MNDFDICFIFDKKCLMTVDLRAPKKQFDC